MERRHMLRAAATLFSRQAIRSEQDVQGSVPGLTGQDADIVLPRLAYMFRNGETSHSMLPTLMQGQQMSRAANQRKDMCALEV